MSKSNGKITKKQKTEFINELFNRKTKSFTEYNFTTDDFIRNDDGKIEFNDPVLIVLLEEAFAQNKEVRFNMESLCVFIEL